MTPVPHDPHARAHVSPRCSLCLGVGTLPSMQVAGLRLDCPACVTPVPAGAPDVRPSPALPFTLTDEPEPGPEPHGRRHTDRTDRDVRVALWLGAALGWASALLLAGILRTFGS